MSRKKKSRKPGAAGAPEFIVTRNRTEADVQGRERKRLKKHKGLKSGSRHSLASGADAANAGQKKDPRLGSKKKIPLVINADAKQTKQQRHLSAEQELALLENDAQLNVLLDRIEAGENLGAGLQKFVDEKLDRIEVLMKQLGIYEDDSEVEEAASEAYDHKERSEDELLADFDDIDLDQYKS